MTRPDVADGVEVVQPRIPRQSAQEQDCRRPDTPADGARLSDELAAVVSGARRRALRDGDRQIDTAHLLHSLLEHDPDVYAVFGEGPQIARLLGYLVQRTIGYGLRWQGTVEDSGAVPVVMHGEGFSPLAASAMEHACRRAALRGDTQARGVDLLAAIVVDPQARAVEVLGRAGIDATVLRARMDEHRDEYVTGGEGAR
ncbi:peptidase [Streptomyces sp. uw30]|nr:peptidase [Streptomyces sp. uw30]